MATQLQLRHGTTAENDTFIGATGEVTIDLDNKELRLHTGDNTEGGYGIARKDFTNLTEESKNISNWSSNVTNCITEIPQDIKLELNDGILTLKAGSKVYVPNGVGVFDEIIVPNDLSYSYAGATVGPNDGLMFYDSTANVLFLDARTQTESGTSRTSVNTFYNTDTNIIDSINDFVPSQSDRISFPVCSVKYGTNVSGTGHISLQKTFNGFGYIGSTRFALPRIEWLSSNGINDDGTSKSIKRTNTNVLVETLSSGTVNNIVMVLATGSIWTSGKYIESETEPSGSYIVWYKPSENILRSKAEGNWNINNNIVVYGYYDTSSDQITGFRTKQPFRAVDYSDTECMTKGALSNIINGADTKVGDVYYTSAADNTSVYAPSGGKWLVLYVVEVNISTAALYLYSADLYHKVGEIVNGGTQITQARSGYGAYVSLLKIS